MTHELTDGRLNTQVRDCVAADIALTMLTRAALATVVAANAQGVTPTNAKARGVNYQRSRIWPGWGLFQSARK